jgi:predicted phage terminase large subunit-like protein
LQPQPGPQRMFLSSTADFTIYGGAAGGGKTWALLLEPLYHIDNPEFAAVIFRRTYPQITNEGGLWDESLRLYPLAGGQPRQSDLEWRFPSGATIRFAHLQHEKDKYSWQGSQIPLICFDELTHFSRSQVLYMASRNRSLCGVRPYMRAGTNPDADSWVKELLAPWVDDEHPEFPYPPGRHRYYTVENDNIVWVDASWRDENGLAGKSLTFVPARVTDNQILLAQNPEYLANLRALPLVEQQRLLYGNWKVRPAAGKVFNRAWLPVVDVAPAGGRVVRFWDFAATAQKLASDDPDWTVGLKLARVGEEFYVLDVVRERAGPAEVKRLVAATASQDGTGVAIGWEMEGGSSGKMVRSDLVALLAGYTARGYSPQGDKVQRATAAASQALGGHLFVLRAHWNNALLSELHGFPDLPHDDQVDALSGAMNMILNMPVLEAPKAVVVSREQVAQQFGL